LPGEGEKRPMLFLLEGKGKKGVRKGERDKGGVFTLPLSDKGKGKGDVSFLQERGGRGKRENLKRGKKEGGDEGKVWVSFLGAYGGKEEEGEGFHSSAGKEEGKIGQRRKKKERNVSCLDRQGSPLFFEGKGKRERVKKRKGGGAASLEMQTEKKRGEKGAIISLSSLYVTREGEKEKNRRKKKKYAIILFRKGKREKKDGSQVPV